MVVTVVVPTFAQEPVAKIAVAKVIVTGPLYPAATESFVYHEPLATWRVESILHRFRLQLRCMWLFLLLHLLLLRRLLLLFPVGQRQRLLELRLTLLLLLLLWWKEFFWSSLYVHFFPFFICLFRIYTRSILNITIHDNVLLIVQRPYTTSSYFQSLFFNPSFTRMGWNLVRENNKRPKRKKIEG